MKLQYTVGSFISPFNSCLKLKGARSLYQNSLEINFTVVSNEGELNLPAAFAPMEKILFLAEIIASQRSALMCNCIAPAIFNLFLNFLSKHPQTFRICS